MLRQILATAFLTISVPGLALAQLGNPTIQLPVVSVFSANTTVSVPDRGGVLIGGVNSSSSSFNRFGPIPSGFGYGSSSSGTSATAHVWIHDAAAMDAALLRRGELQVSGLNEEARKRRAREILSTRSGHSARLNSRIGGQNFSKHLRAVQILRSRR